MKLLQFNFLLKWFPVYTDICSTCFIIEAVYVCLVGWMRVAVVHESTALVLFAQDLVTFMFMCGAGGRWAVVGLLDHMTKVSSLF